MYGIFINNINGEIFFLINFNSINWLIILRVMMNNSGVNFLGIGSFIDIM